MMEGLFYAGGLLGLLSAFIYMYKFYKRQDYGFIGMIITRLYLVVVWGYYLILGEHIPHMALLCTITILMIAEVANSLIYVVSKKYIKRIEINKLKEELLLEYDTHSSKNSVGFFIVSNEGVLKYSNKMLTEMLGYTKEEMREKSIMELVYPDDRHIVLKEISLKLSGEKQISIYNFRIIHKDGSIRKVRVISSVITNGHVSIAGSLFLKED
jgi:PAS domain S-box-containing protein